MDSGHVDGSISKNKYKSCIVPEGLGLWRVGLIIPFRPERPNGQGGLRVKTDDPPLLYIHTCMGPGGRLLRILVVGM